jgi:hypothetical protein
VLDMIFLPGSEVAHHGSQTRRSAMMADPRARRNGGKPGDNTISYPSNFGGPGSGAK